MTPFESLAMGVGTWVCLYGNIDILPSMPTAHCGSMTPTKQQHLALVLILVSVSALALQTPLSTLVHAQQQLTQSLVTINASGIAFRMEDGSSASATLTLTGSSQDDENKKLSDLSGVLQIGSTVYNVSNGQGEGNRQGIIEINADAGGDQNLILHGTNRNGDIVFNFPESKLSSQYSLYLVGQLSSSGSSFTSLSSDTSFSPQSNSRSSLSSQTNNSSSFSTQNSSNSEVSSSTTPNESENATMTPTFTLAPSITQTVTSAAPITQADNSTRMVTVTANVTVTVTTTSTVANTTITVHS